jgi:phospholipid/cholesterol/gamma-HCH transport system substrate-binding protein
MPGARSLTWSQLRVGITAVIALTILAVLIFLLTGEGGFFRRTVTIRTFMDDSSGMTAGAPVRLNGILIGSVAEIRLSGSKDPARVVEFVMEVDRDFLQHIPVDSVAGISAANLLGDKFINITKGQSEQNVRPGAEIASLPSQDIPELMRQSAALLNTLQTIVGRVDRLLEDVEEGRGNIGKFLRDDELYNRLNAIGAEAQQLLVDVRTGKGTLSRLLYDDSLYQEIRTPVKRIDAILAELQNGRGTAGMLLRDQELYSEAQQSMAQVRQLVEDVNAGRGTAGKLLKDEQLYSNINGLVLKVNNVMDRLNAGQGTVGQLMVNPQLYDSMNGATREINSLLRDIRANPRRFLTVRVTLF